MDGTYILGSSGWDSRSLLVVGVRTSIGPNMGGYWIATPIISIGAMTPPIWWYLENGPGQCNSARQFALLITRNDASIDETSRGVDKTLM